MGQGPEAPGTEFSRRCAMGGIMIGTAAGALAHQSATASTDLARSAGRASPISVLDFGADPRGRNDSSSAFRKALTELDGGCLFIPRGRYLVEGIGGLAAAGQQILGESRWNTVLSTELGGGSLFSNELALKGTSAFHLLSDFMIDLNGREIVAIDLASINCTAVQRLHVTGGSALRRNGVGLRFAAPMAKGAYDNAVHDCSFEYLDRGVVWDSGANNNAISNCRITNCRIGIDAAPAEPVDTPRVFGGRIEGCEVGLLEGAQFGAYFALRFEDSASADIRFTDRSRRARIWGGLTATSPIAIADLAKAVSPSIDSGDLGFIAIEESSAQPKISTGRHVFGAAGKPPAVHPLRDFSVQFDDYVLFSNQVAAEFSTAAGNGAIVGIYASSQDELTIPAYNRRTKTYASINFGGGPAIRPLADGVTSLGTVDRKYKAAHVADGVYVGGKRMLSARQPPIADDNSGTPTGLKINQVLRALRNLGLIEG